jgi:hypothetical protein
MKSLAVILGTLAIGLFFLLFGAVGFVLEYSQPPVHSVHLYLFFASAVLGALILPGIGNVVLAKAKDGLAVAAPYLPFGRRAASGEVDITPPSKETPP